MTDTQLEQAAAARISDTVAPRGSRVWAAGEAARLLAELPKKWAHTQEVARHARWAAAGLPDDDRELLIAAAYLHDIGYAASIAESGFHPLDGARYLQHLGLPELACLVAHHTGAAVEAVHRNLVTELAEFPQPTGPVADALTYADVTSGPTGRAVSPGDRFAEIVKRHGADSIVAESRAEARAHMYAAVARTLRRVTTARPPLARLTITPVELGCTTLLRFHGVLDGSTAAQATRMLRDVLADKPHRAVCDLALLSDVDSEGASIFAGAAASSGPGTAITLADPAPALRHLIRVVSEPGLAVVLGIETALVPHCA